MAQAADQKSTFVGPLERAQEAARIALLNRGRDIVVLDMRPVVKWMDFLVLVTGASRRQNITIADEVEKRLKELGDRRRSISGYHEGNWIVLDFGDVVIHVFDAHKRAYYQLENLWGDAPRVDWPRPEPIPNASPATVPTVPPVC